ncbi:hypothetical protein GCM10007916_31600 [Psychromonas marina]|uniref:Uncharacterized protein n=1 Tax=Psychromonas marina TaxID=88364 RepID=A0ABQ6E4F9_9GAMM|nr:hypothetical protein [Psychromonas marina]GLS92090.1 hypothetical protein GCM10007916_31600 [Psychromonas marina]
MQIQHRLMAIWANKYVKTLMKVILALLISLSLTLVCILYTPTIFKSTLNSGLDLLPKNKFIDYKVQNKTEFATEWLEASDALKDDQAMFDLLRTTLPSTSKKDTFFAHMFVVHDYPAPCFFTIFGKHRTIDVTWTVKGIRCKGSKQCNNPQFISQCPPRKIRHK